jgi:hypothetical protein
MIVWGPEQDGDNVELLVERLYTLVRQLRDPEYCGGCGTAFFANRMTADAILFAMFGGVAGSEPVPSALNRARMRLEVPPCR